MTGRPRYRGLLTVTVLAAVALLAALFLAPLSIYLGGGGYLIPGNSAATHALSTELVARARDQGLPLGHHPDLWRLIRPAQGLESQLAMALTRLAAADMDVPKPVRLAFSQLAKGDLTRAEALLGDRASAFKAALNAYNPIYDPDLKDNGGRSDAYFSAATAAADYGVILWLGGHLEKALNAYRGAAQLDPDRLRGWLTYGHVALNIGAPEEAFDAYERVLDQADIYADRSLTALVMGAMALVSITQDNLIDASAFQHEAIRLDDAVGDLARVAVGLMHLGMIHELAGDAKIAETSYGSALQLWTELGEDANAAEIRERLRFLRND